MSSQTHLFTSFPNSQQDIDEMEELLTDEPKLEQEGEMTSNTPATEETPAYSVWQLEYYQKYFNVNTNEVVMKICGSLTPRFNQDYFMNHIRPNPDLYGPFWIAMTLVFTMAISGNFVSFMQNFGTDFKWHTDFHKVTSSAFAIITYWWLVPGIVYGILRWRHNENMDTSFSFVELLSIYGYSLFVYIPCSVLWLINISAIQWILVLIAIGLSGCVLFFTFWPSFSKDSSKQVGVGIMLLVIVLHTLLGLSFMLYFFHDPTSGKVVPDVVTSTMSTVTTVPVSH